MLWHGPTPLTAQGADAIPHVGLWKDVPVMVKEVRRACCVVRGLCVLALTPASDWPVRIISSGVHCLPHAHIQGAVYSWTKVKSLKKPAEQPYENV